MLDEVIRELTAKENNEQTSSEDVLVWGKRIEAQRAQAAILNDITESQKFDKVKLAQKPKTKWDMENTPNELQAAMQVLWWESCTQAVPSLWKNVHWMQENGPLQEGMQE